MVESVVHQYCSQPLPCCLYLRLIYGHTAASECICIINNEYRIFLYNPYQGKHTHKAIDVQGAAKNEQA